MRVFFILLAFLGGSYQWLNGEESYMSASFFVLPCDPLLRNKASEIPTDLIVSDEVQSIIEKMMRIVGNYREDRGNGVMVGLAAPQIGIPLSIIIVDMHVDSSWNNLGDLVTYINPRITWSSDDIIYGIEGCYSVDDHLDGKVPRAKSIKLEAYDRQGDLIQQTYSGFTARIFQHEVDHLNGICFPDRIGPNGILHWIPNNQYHLYKEQWENWPLICPWEVWLEMKEGKPYKDPYSRNE